MQRYFARFNIETGGWEVYDTVTETAVETFTCHEDEELRHYAEHRALAHATRMNQQLQETSEQKPTS